MSEKQNTCCKERPENTLSVDDFPSSKEDSFPSLLLPACHTAGMRLLGCHDSVAMTPEALCPGRAPTLIGKSKQLPSESALHTKNKASEDDRTPVELFQILKDDAIEMLHSICQ